MLLMTPSILEKWVKRKIRPNQPSVLEFFDDFFICVPPKHAQHYHLYRIASFGPWWKIFRGSWWRITRQLEAHQILHDRERPRLRTPVETYGSNSGVRYSMDEGLIDFVPNVAIDIDDLER